MKVPTETIASIIAPIISWGSRITDVSSRGNAISHRISFGSRTEIVVTEIDLMGDEVSVEIRGLSGRGYSVTEVGEIAADLNEAGKLGAMIVVSLIEAGYRVQS
jgi:hypothetical protein